MPRRTGQTDRRTWSAAFLLALGLHAGLGALLLALRPLTPDPVQAQEPEPIAFVFAAPPRADEGDEPRTFTELPEDRADQAPDRPDFLSNVTSRARDEVQGESSLPRLEGISDAPHLRMDPGAGAPAAGAIEPPENPAEAPATPAEQADSRAPDAPERPTEETAAARADEVASFLRTPRDASPTERRAETPGPAEQRLLLLSGAGAQDILQHALDNPGGGTPLSGAISLSTLAWDYAPWLQRFRREFLAGWTAPYAWRMGLIEGTHLLELEIAPSGELRRLDVLRWEGSDALVENSRFSLETMAPYEPLPDGFPDETLILQIQLTYHPVQPRPRRPRSPEGEPEGTGP